MFEVKPSGIHGLGLFADRFIPADTVIGRLEGYYTTQDGSYVLWLTEDQGFRVENEMRYVNHDNEPNAAYYDDLTVTAICDIQPGEEITHNYQGDDAEDDQADHGFDDAQETAQPPSPAEEPAALPEIAQAAS